MNIDLPSISEQQAFVFEAATKAGVAQLQANLKAPKLPGQTEVDESQYPRTHLLTEQEGWEPPHRDLIGAYFRHFQAHFPAYNTDAKLAALLGLSSDRRVRASRMAVRRHLMMFGGAFWYLPVALHKKSSQCWLSWFRHD
ncbi:hypothetical protein [Pseudomonas sp. CFBP 5750]